MRAEAVVPYQARRKQFRVGPAEIGPSAEGASTVGGPGTCSPGKF